MAKQSQKVVAVVVVVVAAVAMAYRGKSQMARDWRGVEASQVVFRATMAALTGALAVCRTEDRIALPVWL